MNIVNAEGGRLLETNPNLEVCPLALGLDGLHDARLPHEGEGGAPVVVLEDGGVAALFEAVGLQVFGELFLL